MSCCGESPKSRPSHGVTSRMASFSAPRGTTFRYLGTSSLTVIGPMTHRVYVFRGPESELSADIRDASYLAAVPLLRAV
jgi:hypothetical protein